jgi:choloylglycine hydrolase
VQYQLDNFSTVDEVIASDQTLRIQNGIGVHYLVCDSTGNCASIEWIDGSLVYHSGQNMPYKVLADSAYDQSVDSLGRFRGFGGFFPIFHPVFYRPSLLRFAIAADMTKKYSQQYSGPAVDYAFQILQDIVINPVFQPAIWSAVYDSSNNQIHFRSRDNKKIRWFDYSNFDFSCTTPVKALNIHSGLSGDVTNNFVDHTKDMDLEMLERWNLTEEEVKDFATYPEKYTSCTDDTDNATEKRMK